MRLSQNRSLVEPVANAKAAELSPRGTDGRFRLRKLMLAGVSLLTACTIAACSTSAGRPPSDVLSSETQDDLWERVVSEFPEAIRPDVSVVREVSLDGWPQAQADCLTSAGFPSRVDDGALSTSVEDAQREPYLIESYRCLVQFPLSPEYTTPLDADQLASLYDYFARDLVPCLESQGYEVGAVPTRQSFVERYYGEEPWTPYLIVGPTVPLDDLAPLEKACPQLPTNY